MDYKKAFEKFENQNALLKTSAPPASVDSAKKAALNRRGNVLYNQGDIEGARRIFLTTAYSDGLSRVGDYYKSTHRLIDALRMYWIAPDRTKFEPIAMQLANILQNLIHEEEDLSDE